MESTVEVFKTGVADSIQANDLKTMLQLHFPGSRINFDLDDCDRILRMEGTGITPEKVLLLVREKGISCHIL